MRPDQLSLLVAPPHLIDKWKREILILNRHAYVAHLDRHEDVKAFMEKAERLGANIPKIRLIKRDMTKLGAGFEPAVIWHQQPVALWSRHQDTPAGYESNQRIVKHRIPKCPTCGETVRCHLSQRLRLWVERALILDVQVGLAQVTFVILKQPEIGADNAGAGSSTPHTCGGGDCGCHWAVSPAYRTDQ